MINNISGQAAVTSTSNNAPQKKEKNNMSSQSTSSNTGAQNTGLGNSAVSGSNMAAAANTTASNSMQQDSAIFLSQSTSTNTSAGQAQGNNPDNVDYQKEALTKLISDLRKDYIERNHYIDENTQISVLQIVNTDTDHIIGQYPSDLYLSLLTKVRESQKQLVNQTI